MGVTAFVATPRISVGHKERSAQRDNLRFRHVDERRVQMQPVGRVAVGTVKGDLHDIGKNLVAAMLEGGGYEVLDLGVNVSPEQFVAAVKEKNVNIVALSALLTTTMPSMKTTIEALKQAGVRDQVKVLIGGAPITQRYADEIGADGFGDSAAGAVALVKQVMS